MTPPVTPDIAPTNHRPDIDGLRSFAILPVLAYHVGIHAVPGGFVGVDVFFVISGFLITQLLARDLSRGSFSLVDFYERRIRRIVPALVAMLLVTSLLYFHYSLPAEFVDFSQVMVAASLSVANVLLWLNSGYFDAASSERPLLHTWSLGVEEQFYLFWPLLLAACHRWMRGRMLWVVAALSLVSFAVSAWGVFHDRSGTFYLVHTRAWELFLGAMIALGAFSAPLDRWRRELLGAVGLALIVGSVFLIHSSMPFPGALALPPCLGAAMVILSGRDGPSVVRRALSLKPLVFVGLISYSLYLWHWPITVLQQNNALLLDGGSERTRKLAIIVVSLVVAALSWRFIEQPFRTGPWRPGKRKMLWIGLGATLVPVALGIAGILSEGVPGRYTERELQIATYKDESNAFRSGRCFLYLGEGQQRRALADECLQLDPARRNYLLIGDSHAAELWHGLQTVYPKVNFLQATAADCYPTTVHKLGESSYCTGIIDGVLHDFLARHPVDGVIIAARWGPANLDNLEATLRHLRGKGLAVDLLGPTLIFDAPFPRLLIAAERSGNPDYLNRHLDPTLALLDRDMASRFDIPGVNYISMIELGLDQGRPLRFAEDGTPLIFDQEHYTPSGSIVMARRMEKLGSWSR